MNPVSRSRQRISVALLALTFVLTFLGGPLLYVSEVIEDEDAFVVVADRVIASPEVEEAIAASIAAVTFETVIADEDLADALPPGLGTFTVPLTLIAIDEFTNVAVSILQTEAVEEVRGTALREVHRQVTSGDEEVVIDLRAVLVRTAREIGGVTVGSGVAKAVSGTDAGQFVLAEAGSSESELIAALALLPALGGLVALFSLAALLLAIAFAVDRPQALMRGGLVLGAAAALSSMFVAVGLAVTFGGLGESSSVLNAVVDVISADFAEQQRGSIVVGAILAAVGLLLGNSASAITLRSIFADLWHRRPGVGHKLQQVAAQSPALTRVVIWLSGIVLLSTWSLPTKRVVVTIVVLTWLSHIAAWMFSATTEYAMTLRKQFGFDVEPATGPQPGDGAGVLRGNIAVLGAITFLVWPGWSQSVVEGIFIVFGLLLVAIDLPAVVRASRKAKAQERELAAEIATATPQHRRYYLASGIAIGAVALGAGATQSTHERLEESIECNGHVELCERRVDEVVFAGSHNSMSSSDLGWDLALQTGDIIDQLDIGVRALLIDALYWDAPSDSEIRASSGGPDIEAALGEDTPQPGAWMCHVFCALGATNLTDGLTEISLWLESHPREVLLIVVQDEVSAQDLTDAFVDSGLHDLAYVHASGSQYPTLEELIEADTRLLVYGENQGEPDTWFQNAWESTFRETPFNFAVQGDFSCEPNRGDDDNELFLMNHWLTTGIPVREVANSVNSRSTLLERVDKCLEERGQLPTVLAVDFVETGELIAVVDELNQVG